MRLISLFHSHWLRQSAIRSRPKGAFVIHHSPSGVALVIVLAFIVLLSGVMVAFFSRAILDRQISNSSASQTKTEIFAQGAADQIIGDLKKEIADGSTLTTITTGTATTNIYAPKATSGGAAATVMPAFQGFTPTIASGVETDGLNNLLKRSAYNLPFYDKNSNSNYAATGPNRAANVSTANASQNGRLLSKARWNKPLLMQATSATDYTPAASVAFTAPDWILVARDGSNPTSWNANLIPTNSSTTTAVVARYAYNMYDEGGLLDVNAAGYPSTATAVQSGSKNALAYADLTQMGLTKSQVDTITGWRNYASAATDLTQNPAITTDGFTVGFPNYDWSAKRSANYFNYLVSNTKGFLSSGNIALSNGQSDHQFTSRQELIKFMLSGVSLSNTDALQYLTHFSRDLNQPSYISAVQTNASAPVVLATNLGGSPSSFGGDKLINPSFPNTRVQAIFPRNDGTTAKVGDPLVNKRFALQRLAWITYKGPSSSRSQGDPDIQALINNGIPWSYLQLGDAPTIQKYFGLKWDGANNRWLYNIHNGGSTGTGKIMLVGRPTSVTTQDASTYVQDANRDPDFFELLKAGISVGSLGKAAAGVPSGQTIPLVGNAPPGYNDADVPVNVRYPFDSSVDYHVIQIGANILSEVNPTSYPVRIAYDDGVVPGRGLWEFQGVTDLPYLSYVFNGVLRTQAPNPAPVTGGGKAADTSPFQYPVAVTATLTNPGNAYMVQVPAMWNPYDPNGTASVLRPAQFRVLVNSNDPVSLIHGNADKKIAFFSAASKNTSGPGGTNVGLQPPNAAYSIGGTGLGGTPALAATTTTINDAVTFNDSNGTLYREPTLIFNPAVGGAARTAGNITGLDANPLPGETDGSKGPWAPLVLGQFPLAFSDNANTTIYYTGSGFLALAAGTGDNRIYLTYRLQYQDASGNWITYDTKYGRTTHGIFAFQSRFDTGSPGFSPSVVTASNIGFNPYSWASAIDPRTARFGLITDALNVQRSAAWGVPAPASAGWIYDSTGTAATVGITYPIRQDNTKGFYFANFEAGNLPLGGATAVNQTVSFPSTRDNPYPGCPAYQTYPPFCAGWTAAVAHISADVWMFAPGMYAQNSPGAPFYDGGNIEPTYYADADGVVRRGVGAYVPVGSGVSASTTVGLPTSSINGYTGKPASLMTPSSATPFTQSQSRPLLLHRPFRTVAELGYVFRDLPWKNIDFFTPESGDAALLDVFCINETSDPNGLVAGKVNLNTRQTPVLAAIVSGACVDDPKVTNTTVGSLSATLANSVATALTARTTDTTTNYGSLQNISELIGKWNSAAACSSGVSYSPSNPVNKWGVDLPLASGYQDGRASYIGFSGNTVTNSGKDLSSVFSSISPGPTTSGSLAESLAYVKRFREAPIRALSNVGQTRVWNLMIDVVAQTGRYPQSATTLANFAVEGEQRYWVHVAIDRLTGQVIDKQIESVKE